MAQEIADSTLLDTWASSGLIVEPDISKIIEGWQLGEQPPHEYMNWLQNTFGSKLNHILKNGVAEWNNETEYLAGATVQHNGFNWTSKTTNTNSEPADVNENWSGYVALTGNQTIAGVKTFSSQITATTADNVFTGSGLMVNGDGSANTIFPSIGFHQPGLYAGNIALTSLGVFSFFKTDGATIASIKANLIGNAETVTNGVYTTGNQTIAGVKTFSSSPIVPTPTTNTQVANKAYVDSKAEVAFVANDARVKTALNASGDAPIYACRAWVNFNGTDTVAIRASRNVSSITDNEVGIYTVNFTTAMQDNNYSCVWGHNKGVINTANQWCWYSNPTTTSVSLNIFQGVGYDTDHISCSIFR